MYIFILNLKGARGVQMKQSTAFSLVMTSKAVKSVKLFHIVSEDPKYIRRKVTGDQVT